nr:MAG TPA: hypothetical protein [Caudoviricetes sp.]
MPISPLSSRIVRPGSQRGIALSSHNSTQKRVNWSIKLN